jgi:hypothetical protein
MMKFALPAVGVALPFMFPAAAGAAAAGAAGAGAAAGGAGLAGTGLAGGAAIPLTGLGPGGIGMASFGGGPVIGGAPFLPSAGSGGLFTSMGVGPNTVMPHAGIPRFMGALKNSFGGSMKDPKNYLRYATQALGGSENQEQNQMRSPPPPLMGPPIMGGNLERGGTSFAETMAPAITTEVAPSVLPPAVLDDGGMGAGALLPAPLSGDLSSYLRHLQQQPQY